MNDLDTKVLNAINTATHIERYMTPPKYQNTVSCTNYEVGRIILERPNNGCTSFKVLVDGVPVGRVDSDIIDDAIYSNIDRIKKGLINSL